MTNIDLQNNIREIMKENISPGKKNKHIQQLLNSNKSNVNITIKDCTHYIRHCRIIASCCNKVYDCRLCHDKYETHNIDRFSTKEIICKICETKQPISNKCVQCNKNFAKYFCKKCNFWDSKKKFIYHCKKCKICRSGKKNNFIHCDNCNGCIPKSKYTDHICRKNIFDHDCPICMENLFSSTIPVSVLKCGHTIHLKCYQELRKFDYKCPICKKCVINVNWANYEYSVKMQKMPDEYKFWETNILCNDCNKKSTTKYHFIGHKCIHCKSWNTNIIKILKI